MHALRNCHRMLVPEGTLLDLHPIPPSMHAFAGGKDLGVVDERSFFPQVRATERETRRAVAEGLFEQEDERELDVLERFASADDLFETVEEWGNIRVSKRLRARILRAEPPIDFHERLVLRRYRSQSRGAQNPSSPGF